MVDPLNDNARVQRMAVLGGEGAPADDVPAVGVIPSAVIDVDSAALKGCTLRQAIAAKPTLVGSPWWRDADRERVGAVLSRATPEPATCPGHRPMLRHLRQVILAS